MHTNKALIQRRRLIKPRDVTSGETTAALSSSSTALCQHAHCEPVTRSKTKQNKTKQLNKTLKHKDKAAIKHGCICSIREVLKQ